jgi:hypothetical protein
MDRFLNLCVCFLAEQTAAAVAGFELVCRIGTALVEVDIFLVVKMLWVGLT